MAYLVLYDCIVDDFTEYAELRINKDCIITIGEDYDGNTTVVYNDSDSLVSAVCVGTIKEVLDEA